VSFPGTERFEIVRKLGEGGMGVVYEAFDRERSMPVALKTLRNLDATSLYRFKREFRALSDISHPNIVGLYELVSEGSDWFFTMELLEGADFLSYIRPAGFDTGLRPLPSSSDASDPTAATRTMATALTPRTAAIGVEAPTPNDRPYPELVDDRKLRRGLIQLAQALDVLHRAGMVHRDLKPSNIHVTPTERIVVMDFGIVADTARPDEDGTGAFTLGTPLYMAPEQAAGEPPTAAADWYSVGVVLYLALTDRMPFSGSREAILVAKQSTSPVPPGMLTRDIPPALARLCSDLLARRPETRPSGAEVLSRLGAPSEVQEVSSTGGASAFVGRTSELSALHRAYRDMRDGRPMVGLLVGSSGMGKSTLVRRFLHEIEAQHAARDLPVILRGRCHERESLPYKAFDTIVDHLSHFLIGVARERVAALLPDDVDLLTRLFPVLRRVPGIQASRPLGGLDRHELRVRAFGVLRELLQRIAEWRPVIIHIDDLQWADADSIDLLSEILRPPDAPRILLVCAIRREDLDRIGPDASAAASIATISSAAETLRIELGPLSDGEQRELVQQLLGSDGAAVEHGFLRESAGSPLLLGELVRYAQDLGDELPAGGMPGLEEVLYRRICRLPGEARALLEAVTVAGEPAPLSALAAATDLDATAAERASAVLRVGNLVRVVRHRQEVWLAPYHDRIRETLDQRLASERTRQLHQHLAQALERSEAGTVDALARHWLAAGDVAQATTYLLSAAEAASAKLAFGRASELYRAALELGGYDDARASELRRGMAAALASAGRYYEAALAYAEAARQASDERAADLERLSADNYLRSGHVRAGLDAMAAVMSQVGVGFATSHRRALISLGWQRVRRFFRGRRYKPRAADEIPARDLGRLDTLYAASTSLGMIDHIRGADLQTRHLLMALKLGEKIRVCRALAVEAVYLAAAGGRSRDRSETLAREVETLARQSDDPYLIALAHLAVGAATYFGARPRIAIQEFAAAERLLSTECVGADWERVTARFFICNAQIQLGQLAEVASTARRYVERSGRDGDVYVRSLFQTQPSTWLHLLRDDPAAAIAAASGSLEGWPDDEYYIAHHVVHIARGIALIYRGDHQQAFDLLDGLIPQLRRSQLMRIPWLMAEWQLYRGRAALALGNDRAVRAMIKHVEAQAYPPAVALGKAYRAFLVLRERVDALAVESLMAAQRALEESDFIAMARAMRYRCGQLVGGSEGRRMSQESVEWFAAIGAVEPLRLIAIFAPPVAVEKPALLQQ
jgi:eukaryotic-like serine/threonine-protein kinase